MPPSKVDLMTSASPAGLSRPPLPSGNPPRNPNPAQEESPKTEDTAGSTTTEGAPHVDAIDWEADYEKAADALGDETHSSEDVRRELGLEQIDKETFFANFKGLFALGGMIPVPPLPLECLPIKPEEEAAARGASDALYDICAETPFLQFLLSPESEWAKRGFAILAFMGPKVMAARAELAAKARAVREAREAGQKPPAKPAPVSTPDGDPQAL